MAKEIRKTATSTSEFHNVNVRVPFFELEKEYFSTRENRIIIIRQSRSEINCYRLTFAWKDQERKTPSKSGRGRAR